MWPSYSNGQKITKCNSGTQIQVTRDENDLFEQMDSQWISYTGDNLSFWSHEMNSHGYCYIQKYKIDNYNDYFRKALQIFNNNNLDTLMKEAFGEQSETMEFSVTELKQGLKRASGGLNFDLDCIGHNGQQHLREVRFYFDLDFETVRNDSLTSNCKSSQPVYVHFE